MKTSFLKLFIPLLVGFLGKVGAQEQSCMFTHYSLDDGLSQNTVMSMAQDSKGVMWFATWNGLNRFDGTRFYNYKVQWGNPSGLSNSRIDHIRLDRYDRIWGTTYSRHACFFNPLTEEFSLVPAKGDVGLDAAIVKEGGDEGRVLIGVADQGIGFDESKKRSIFLRFENLVDRKLFQQSTGIGLSLVKELVEMHGADIEVESRPGEGSCFTVCFRGGKAHFAPGTEFLQDDASVQLLSSRSSRHLPAWLPWSSSRRYVSTGLSS